MFNSYAILSVLLGFTLLGSASGQVIYQDDFEKDFRPVPQKEKNWNANAEITGETASEWSDNSSWADVGAVYSRDEGNPHSGKACQKIEVKRVTSGAVQFVHSFKAEKGKIYQGKLWLRGSPSTTLTFGLRQLEGPYQTYGTESATLSPEWREFSIQAEIPKDDKVIFIIWVNSPATFWVDDASIEIVDPTQIPPPPEGNILSNASFEAGIPENWSFHVEGPDNIKLLDPRPRLSNEGAVGTKSLSIEIPKEASGQIRSSAVSTTKGQVYSISLWARATREIKLDAGLADTNMWLPKFTVGPEWKRFTFKGKMEKFKKFTWLQINIPKMDSDYTVYVDGVMIEAKPEPSKEYSENFPYEFTVMCDRIGHIFFDGEKAAFKIGVAPAQKNDMKIRIEVQDLYGKKLGAADMNLDDAGTLDVAADALKRGIFKMSAMLVDAKGQQVSAKQEITWARLPRPVELPDPGVSYFGIHIPLVGDYISIAKLTGQRWVRLHDSSMIGKWNSLEPKEGEFKFYDENVDLAKKEGLMILGMLDGAPPWMGSKDRGGYWSYWTIPTRADWKEKWRNYCDTAISHYKGRIDDWEIWNEPWGDWFLSAGGDPKMYVEFMRQAKASAAANNPKAKIVGVDTYAGHEKWTEGALQGGTEVFDIFSYHDYSDAIAGGAEKQNRCNLQVEQLRKWQEKFGKVKPIWNTEGGVFELGSFLKPDAPGLKYNLQPAYIVRFDTCLRAAGVQKFFYYAIHLDPAEGENSCRATEVGRAIKPLLAARAIFAWLTDGANFKERTESDGVECYAFEPIRGKQVTVCWSLDGQDKKLQVPAGSTALDIWGNEMVPADGGVTVGSTPVYLVIK